MLRWTNGEKASRRQVMSEALKGREERVRRIEREKVKEMKREVR